MLERCTNIEAHHRAGNSKAMYSEIKKLTRTFTPSLNTLTESADILNRWQEYCSELYTDNENQTADATENHEDDKPIEDGDLIPLRSEVELAMKFLKRGKSPSRIIPSRKRNGNHAYA